MKTPLIIFTLAFSFFISRTTFGQEGEKLFKTNCGACHTIGGGKLVGPDLLGVNDRHPEAWTLKWVKSSQKMIKAGDTTAVRLFKENNGMPMTDQSLQDSEIKAVLAFIKGQGAVAQAPAAEKTAEIATIVTTPAKEKMAQDPSVLNMFSTSEYILFALFLFLVIVIWVLSSAIKTLTIAEK